MSFLLSILLTIWSICTMLRMRQIETWQLKAPLYARMDLHMEVLVCYMVCGLLQNIKPV